MNQPKQTISKTEAISDTEERRIKLSNGNGLLAHIDIADEVVAFSNYHVKFKVGELSFDDITYLATVINNLPSRVQHSYSEQEVKNIINQVKMSFANNANSEVIKQEIIKLNFDGLLIKK